MMTIRCAFSCRKKNVRARSSDENCSDDGFDLLRSGFVPEVVCRVITFVLDREREKKRKIVPERIPASTYPSSRPLYPPQHEPDDSRRA